MRWRGFGDSAVAVIVIVFCVWVGFVSFLEGVG